MPTKIELDSTAIVNSYRVRASKRYGRREMLEEFGTTYGNSMFRTIEIPANVYDYNIPTASVEDIYKNYFSYSTGAASGT